MNGIKGFLIGISITFGITLVLYVSSQAFNDSLLSHSHVDAIKQRQPVQLNDDNLVETIVKHVDTSHLKSVQFHNHVLAIELLVDENLSATQFIYLELPQYAAYAFFETSNVRQLKLKVLEEQGIKTRQALIFTASMFRDDAWLSEGLAPLLEVKWLEDLHWRQVLRINTTNYWQMREEI